VRNRFFVFVFFSITCAFLGLLYVTSKINNSVTLADLVSQDYPRAETNEILRELFQSVRGGAVQSPNIDLIFYAVLAVCGVLLALRAIVSAVRMARMERVARQRETSVDSIISAMPNKPAAKASRRSLEIDAPPRRVGVVTEQSPFVVPPSDGAHLLSTRWPRLASYGHGFTGKMVFTFTGIIALFGSLTLILVYFTLAFSLTNGSIQRARLIALNVSDSIPGYIFKKDAARLRESLRKYASRPGVAYVLVEDRKGEIFAHSFTVLPQQVQDAAPSGDRPRNAGQRLFQLGEGKVYEVGVPVLEGQAGAVRVGIWKDEIDDEIRKAVQPIIKFIVLVFCGGFLMAIFLTWRITRPILRLVRTARRVSDGELDIPSPGINDTTEFGELSRSFERMRSSVRAAMIRLRE
jgi:HAMP domain-containing protein